MYNFGTSSKLMLSNHANIYTITHILLNPYIKIKRRVYINNYFFHWNIRLNILYILKEKHCNLMSSYYICLVIVLRQSENEYVR